MSNFLYDPPLAGIVTLALLTLIAAGLWVRYRKKPLLAVSLVLLVLFFAWLVIGLLFESPREESVRRVNEMAAALNAKDWAEFGENVSESYSDAKNRKKADLKKAFDDAGRLGIRAAVWNVELTDPPVVTDTEVKLRFDGKAEAQGREALAHFQVTFVKDPDGKFRLKEYKSFDYVQKNQQLDVP